MCGKMNDVINDIDWYWKLILIFKMKIILNEVDVDGYVDIFVVINIIILMFIFLLRLNWYWFWYI